MCDVVHVALNRKLEEDVVNFCSWTLNGGDAVDAIVLVCQMMKIHPALGVMTNRRCLLSRCDEAVAVNYFDVAPFSCC